MSSIEKEIKKENLKRSILVSEGLQLILGYDVPLRLTAIPF
jgi:hypothetical protein